MKTRAPTGPSKMSDETEEERTARLKAFVVDYCSGRIFTSLHLSETELDILPMVFMPLALGAKVPEDVVVVWEHLDKAGPRSINGYPSFWSCHFMNKADYARVRPVIEAELKRRAEIKV